MLHLIGKLAYSTPSLSDHDANEIIIFSGIHSIRRGRVPEFLLKGMCFISFRLLLAIVKLTGYFCVNIKYFL